MSTCATTIEGIAAQRGAHRALSTPAPQRPLVDGERLRAARLDAGLSASDLHRRILGRGERISLAALTRIERGGGTRPRTRRIIADALGCHPEDLAPRPVKLVPKRVVRQ